MRISDWSSDVCSSDLLEVHRQGIAAQAEEDALTEAEDSPFAPEQHQAHRGERQRKETAKQVEVIAGQQPWRGDREAQGGDAGDGGERELGHAGTLFGVARARTDRDDALRPELEEEDDEEQGQHLREADIDEEDRKST